MRCKNCKSEFGLNLELGFENENIGSCSVCLTDVCASCGLALRIETQVVLDPVLICRQCCRSLSEASRAAVA